MNLSVNKISPSFSGLHVQMSKMNSHQRELANSITDLISYDKHPLREANDNGIDIYIVPGEHKRDIKLKFLDIYDEKFITNDDGTPMELTTSKLKRRFDVLEQFKQSLYKLNTFTSSNDLEDEQVLTGQTDLLRLRPELFDDILDDLDKNKDNNSLAISTALNHHMDTVGALFARNYEEF